MSRKLKIAVTLVWGIMTLLLTSVQVVPILIAGRVGTQYGVELGNLGVMGAIIFSLFSLFISAFVVTIFMVVITVFIAVFGQFLGQGPVKM